MRMCSDQVLLPSTSVPQTWSERLLVFKETRRGKLQNFHMEVAESGSADCGCDLARRGGLQETRWPTFGMSEMPSDAQHCAALHRGLSSTVYSGSLCVEPSRAEAQVSHRGTRLLAEHTPVHRHAQRASYKKNSESVALSGWRLLPWRRGNQLRACACERAYINERGNLAEFNQSRRLQSFFPPPERLKLSSSALQPCATMFKFRECSQGKKKIRARQLMNVS